MNACLPTPLAATGTLQALASASEMSLAQIPDSALHAARRALIDWLGVAIAGSDSDPVRLLRAALGASPSNAGYLGAPELPAYADAWIMGCGGHVLDYDDTDFKNLVHVSASLMPALLAIARRRPVGGDRLLRAIVAGYEMEVTLGQRLGRPLTARGWHVTGVLGHFGAALSASVARELDVWQTTQALGLAAAGSSGLIAAFGTMGKSFQVGRSAASGVVAAELAAGGFTGAAGALDGECGFTETYVGEHIDWSQAAYGWGQDWGIAFNSFKPHSACMITHPSIDAAMALRERLAAERIPVSDVEAITCRVNVLAPKVAVHRFPANGLEGKFSVSYCVAAGLVDGQATPDAFEDAATQRTDIQRLLAATTILADPTVGEQQSHITLQLRGGRVLRQQTEMAKGNPANPMSDDDIGSKFFALTQKRVNNADALLQGLWRFGEHADAGQWLAAHLP